MCDQLRGCYNFVNNASPFKTNMEKNTDIYKQNFGNMKAQCYFMLKQYMERRAIRVNADGLLKNAITLQLDNVLVKPQTGADTKVYLESKEDMKKRMNGKSPDHCDAIAMRMIWVVRQENDEVREEDL